MYLKDQLFAVRNEFMDFTYTISHDLGTPLRAVVNFSKLLATQGEGTLNEKCTRYLQFVIEGGEKLQAMLTGLVHYSRLNTQGKPPETLEIGAIIGQCHASLKEKIADCKGTIRVHGTLPGITADPEQCFQLFLVLVDNALTYHAPGVAPEIHISAQDMGNAWQFSVEDNGIGIAPANAERVFEVFKRLHTDEEYPGTGMGLALARKIVGRHGGEIRIAAGKNGGTLCWFTFPKVLPETANIPALQKASHG